MLRNYFKIAFRNIIKNKLYSSINVMGLAIGMAGFILIAAWIWNERSYDQFHENKSTVYKVWNRYVSPGYIGTGDLTQGPLAKSLKNNYPEVQNSSRIYWSIDRLFNYEDKNLKAKGNDVDKAFLQMFSFPLVSGDAEHALDDIHNIVITEDLAKKLFGTENAINKVVKIDNKDPYKVTGVLKNLPKNTSFDFEYLVSLEANENFYSNNWNSNAYYTFIQTRPGVSAEQVNKKIKNEVLKHNPESKAEIFLHPMSKWHLYSRFENGKIAGGRIEIIQLLLIIGLLILLIACINFMNLSTAQSQNRAKEVGVRKVIGAGKRSLVTQFLAESILIAALAAVLALMIVTISLPAFNKLTGRELTISYDQPIFWLLMLAFVLLTGVLAGSYPAFFLSSFRPIKVLTGKLMAVGNGITPRKILVVLQFTVAIVLITSTTVIYRQISFVQKRNTGYNINNLVEVPIEGDIQKNYDVIRTELLASGAVSAICKTSLGVTSDAASSGLEWQGMDPELKNLNFSRFGTTGDFVKTMGLKLVDGRDLNLVTHPADTLSILLNTTAVKQMGLKTPVGQIIKHFGDDFTVVGVFEDFIIGSPYENVKPMFVLASNYWTYNTVLRLNAANDMSKNIAGIEKIFKRFNPAFPFNYRFVDQQYAEKFNDQKQTATLSALFAGLTIFISCIGLFGLATFMAGNRTKEIGIRKVLGASVASITNMLASDFIKLVMVAIVIATPVSYYLMNKWLTDFTYRISIGWATFAVVGITAILIALLTVSFQSIRAAMGNPVKNLRTE